MKQLFYVVEKQLNDVDGFEETNGWKTITVYKIEDNQPKQVCEFEAHNSDNSIEEIQTWLDNNNDETEYEFIQL